MEVSTQRRKHAFDNPARYDRFVPPPVAKKETASISSANDGHFEIFIHPTPASPTTASSTGSGKSSSGRSGSLTVDIDETHIHMKCTRSVYEAIWRKSLRLRSALEHALAMQRTFTTLYPEPENNIDATSITFMIRNLHRESANYSSAVTIDDLVRVANTLWTYRCSPVGFVHGWQAMHRDYKTPRRTPPSPGVQRTSTSRSWWEQPRLWGAGSRTPLRLLVIAWVFGACSDEFNAILASELITAVWDCHVHLPTSVPEIQHVEDYRMQECAYIFEDFKTLTGATGDSRKDLRMKQLRLDAANSLALDFSGNCYESAHDQISNQNFAILNSFTPYDLLRNIEMNLLGNQPNGTANQSGKPRPKSGSVSRASGSRASRGSISREYPRDPPDINWKKVGSSMKSAFAGTFDSDIKAQKEEIGAILDRMEIMVQQRQLRLIAEWIKTRDGQQAKLINELDGIFTISLTD